jgi:hypothetical protein
LYESVGQKVSFNFKVISLVPKLSQPPPSSKLPSNRKKTHIDNCLCSFASLFLPTTDFIIPFR